MIDPRRWDEVQGVFHELIALEPADRSSRLAAIGATDPALRDVVGSLLVADAEAEARLAPLEATFRSGPAPAPDLLGLAGRTISHFHVLEPLGAGGMGVVYRAEDTRLGRSVALKFLLPQYSLDAAAKERFLREAHSAAALDHPNLCTIHEVGETEDRRLFLAMALYSGETLKARLAREGPLPVEDALAIARQIVEGLACAHAAGIVHRDLKPGNVMLLPDGTAKVLDFGLAKARDDSLSASSAQLGTAPYMAPEQVRDERVDGRTDLWALGVLLYEMLTGRKPFAGEHDAAIAHAILHDEPAPPSKLRADIPAAIDEVILTLLEKDADNRYASADALLGELATTSVRRSRFRARWRFGRRLRLRAAVIGIIAFVAAGVVLTIRGKSDEAAALSRVIVMPFENRTGDPNLDPVGAITADWVAQGLNEPGFLAVLDSWSALAAAQRLGATASPEAVGRETGAGVVVAGSYFLQGDSLQFQARVASTADGTMLMTIGGIAATQGQPLAGAEQLRQRMLGALASLGDKDVSTFQTRLAQPPTYDAYREYSEGLAAYMGPLYPEAARHFQRAAALDSTFLTARLWAVQSDWSGVPYSARGDTALIALRPLRDRLSRFDRARYDWLVPLRAWHLDDAYLASLQMVEAAPGSLDAQREAALSALRVFRPREALRRLKKLDPESGIMREWDAYWSALAWAHHQLGEHEEELAAARRGLDLFPGFASVRFAELRALAALGRVGELDSLARAHFRADPDWTWGHGGEEFANWAGYEIAAELLAHGHVEAARRLARHAAELVATRAPPDSFGTEGKERWLARRVQLALLLGETEVAATCIAQLRPNEWPNLRALVLAAQGRRDSALATIQDWKRQAIREGRIWGRNWAIYAAAVLTRVGDLNGALHALAETSATDPLFLFSQGSDGHNEPALAPLWSDPRFRALIKPKG